MNDEEGGALSSLVPEELSSHEEVPGQVSGLSAADPRATLQMARQRMEQLTQLKEQMRQQAQARQAAMERAAQMYEHPLDTGMDPGLIALARGIASHPASQGLMGFTEGMQGMQEARQKLAERDWARKAAAEKLRAQSETQGMTDLQNEGRIDAAMLSPVGRTYAPRDYVSNGHHIRDTYNPNTGTWDREDLGEAPSSMRGHDGARLPIGMKWVEGKEGQEMEPIAGSGTSKLPAGYRWTDSSNTTMTAIPGGPKDTHGAEPSLSPEALKDAAINYNKSGTLPPNMGRGAQGAANSTAIQNLAAKTRREEGLDPNTLLDIWGIRKGQTGAYADIAKNVNKIDLAVNEGFNSMKLTQEMADKVPRTAFPALNGGVQFFEKHIGDPNLRAFQASLNTMVNTYARAINPKGQSTVSDKEHARELLSSTDSPEAFNAVMDVLRREMAIAKESSHQTLKESEPGARDKGASSTHPKDISDLLGKYGKH